MTPRDVALKKLAQTIHDLSVRSADRAARDRRRRRARVMTAMGLGVVLGIGGTLAGLTYGPALLQDDEQRLVAGAVGLPVAPTGAVASPVLVEETVGDVAVADNSEDGLRAVIARELGANASEPGDIVEELAYAGGPEVAVSTAASPDDGLPAWQENATAVALVPGQPAIAIVIDDVGIDRRRSQFVVDLPAPLTISMLPYARGLDGQAAAARAAGHELLVHVPMEPHDHTVDPGPEPLLTALSHDELHARLDRALAAFDGYVGVNNHMGSRFTEDRTALAEVMETLQSRGLLFLDSRTSETSAAFGEARLQGVPAAQRDVFIDHDPSPAAIDAALLQLERVALRQGYAVGIGHPKDATLDALREWLPHAADMGFALVPISTIVELELAAEAG